MSESILRDKTEMELICELQKQVEELRHSVEHLQKITGDIFAANQKYHSTRDTAKADAFRDLLIRMHRETLEELRDR